MSPLVKLDLRTRIFLYVMRANIVQHKTGAHDVYVFEDYEDYINFFKKYIDDPSENLIKSAIFTTGKQGQIVALKAGCEQIIAAYCH